MKDVLFGVYTCLIPFPLLEVCHLMNFEIP